MDRIHDPDGRAWISEPIVVGDYFKEFSDLVQEEKPLRDLKDLRSKWTMKHPNTVAAINKRARLNKVLPLDFEYTTITMGKALTRKGIMDMDRIAAQTVQKKKGGK